jgi:hypothetical protein
MSLSEDYLSSEDLHPIDIVHHQIGDHHVVGVLLKHPLALRTTRGDLATVTDLLKTLGHGPGMRRIVIHD